MDQDILAIVFGVVALLGLGVLWFRGKRQDQTDRYRSSVGTVNGIGTFYYGSDARRGDGSQVATLFFVLFFLPIVPIRTRRIRKTAISGARMKVEELESLPLRWRQVLLTYVKCWVLMPIAILAPYIVLVLLGRHGIARPDQNSAVRVVLEWGWIYTIGMAAYFLGRARRA
jgi:hypothetical protein